MQHMAIDERSYSSLEKALDEAMAIMRGFPQIWSFQLYYWMPLDMLLLGHYYDAYNLLKHWLKVCQDFSNGFPVEPTSEDPAENIFESLEIDIKKHPKPAADNFQILALALLKFKTIQALNDKFNLVMKGSSLANVQHVNVAVVNVKRKIHHFLTKNQEKHFNFYLDAIEDPYPGFLETLLLRKNDLTRYVAPEWSLKVNANYHDFATLTDDQSFSSESMNNHFPRFQDYVDKEPELRHRLQRYLTKKGVSNNMDLFHWFINPYQHKFPIGTKASPQKRLQTLFQAMMN